MSGLQTEVAWRIGGPQGSGVDTGAGLFTRACAMGGLHLIGRREYYSNIKGRHSYYDVRVAAHELTSHRTTVDLLTTFEEETLARHALSVVAGGGLIYDPENAGTELQKITFLDQRAKDDLSEELRNQGLPASTGGLIQTAESRGVNLYPVPFNELTEQLADEQDLPLSFAQRTLNTMAVAVSMTLLGYDSTYLARALENMFSQRDRLIELNLQAAELAAESTRSRFDVEAFDYQLQPVDVAEQRILVNGNQSVAMAKLAAGMTFQTYYPISPATDESVWLESHESFPLKNGEEGSVTVVQTEDELAAVTMASGAALTGARSATATSGPGFSLMTEGLGWAGMNEVPLVVTLYQRGSPSTGVPTRTEQGDLQFVLRAGHGEFPRIVVASGDLTEAFYDAARAFNYAERYQMVVVHLMDKTLASMMKTVTPFDIDAVSIERGNLYVPPDEPFEPDGHFERFAPTESGVSTRSIMGQRGGTHWLTGTEHTPLGRVTEDPVIREQMVEKRARKLETAAAEIPQDEKFAVYGDPAADFTIMSWGSTKGSLLEALDRLEAGGIKVRLIQVKLLTPFPVAELTPMVEQASPLVVAEHNYSGQFAQLVREQTGRQTDHLIVKYSGRPMSGGELYGALSDIVSGEGEARIVLRNPNE